MLNPFSLKRTSANLPLQVSSFELSSGRGHAELFVQGVFVVAHNIETAALVGPSGPNVLTIGWPSGRTAAATFTESAQT